MEQIQKVINYYKSTEQDYKNLWVGPKDLAVHFGYYDDKSKKHPDAVLRLNELLSKYGKISSTDNVLDAGCGYGGSAIWLAEHIGCRVTGVNIVDFQIEKGMREIRKRGLTDKVKLFKQNFSHTNFAGCLFDVFLACESIVHAEDRQEVLGEAFRLLKNGGRLVIAEYTYRENPPLSKKELEYLSPWLQNWAMPKLLTPSEYVSQLTMAGFRNIKQHDLTNNIKPSLRRLKFLCQCALPGAKVLRFFGIFDWQRTANVEGSLRQARALDKDLWCYTVFTADKILRS